MEKLSKVIGSAGDVIFLIDSLAKYFLTPGDLGFLYEVELPLELNRFGKGERLNSVHSFWAWSAHPRDKKRIFLVASTMYEPLFFKSLLPGGCEVSYRGQFVVDSPLELLSQTNKLPENWLTPGGVIDGHIDFCTTSAQKLSEFLRSRA